MAEETTRIAKGKAGYGYKYTELAQINEWLEAKGESYYQYTEDYNGKDYIMTVKVNAKGEESKPIRGCQIIDGNTLNGGKANVAQQLGAAITYARRYSLLMAYGLATEDDDAESLTQQPRQQTQRKATRQEIHNPTAADVTRIARETAQQLGSDDEYRQRVCSVFERQNDNWKAKTLENFGIQSIAQADQRMLDNLFNFFQSKGVAV